MKINNKITKIVSLTLCVSFFGNIIPSAKAIIPNQNSNSYLILESLENGSFTEDERMEYEKAIEMFQGLEDTSSYKIDKVTGEVTHINYNSANEVISRSTTNFYENLQKLINERSRQKNELNNIIPDENKEYFLLDGTIKDDIKTQSGYMIDKVYESNFSSLDSNYGNIQTLSNYEIETVHKSNFSSLDSTYYVVGTLAAPKVDCIKISNSTGSMGYGLYYSYKEAPYSINNFYGLADQTISYGNTIVSAIGVSVGIAVVSLFFGAAVTESALGKALASFGIAYPGIGSLALTLRSYYKARDNSDEAYRVAVPGWHQVNGNWYWYESGGAVKSEWRQIDGYWYYLKSDGVMATGWLQLGGKWYWFESNGAMFHSNWKQIGPHWYCFDGNGAALTGWHYLNNKWYYFYGSCEMATNTVIDGWRIDSNGVATKI